MPQIGLGSRPAPAIGEINHELRVRRRHHGPGQRALPAAGQPRYERRILQLPYRGATTPVPVHLLSAAGDCAQAPVLLFSGGLDSWKMDLHALAVGFALGAGVTVMAFDHPGTGEDHGAAGRLRR